MDFILIPIIDFTNAYNIFLYISIKYNRVHIDFLL